MVIAPDGWLLLGLGGALGKERSEASSRWLETLQGRGASENSAPKPQPCPDRVPNVAAPSLVPVFQGPLSDACEKHRPDLCLRRQGVTPALPVCCVPWEFEQSRCQELMKCVCVYMCVCVCVCLCVCVCDVLERLVGKKKKNTITQSFG